MKIFDNGSVKNSMESYLLEISKKRERQVSNEAENEKTTSQQSPDKVDISFNAKEMQRAREVVKESPDTRSEEVKRIESDIKNNTYNVKGEIVADKLIKETILNSVL